MRRVWLFALSVSVFGQAGAKPSDRWSLMVPGFVEPQKQKVAPRPLPVVWKGEVKRGTSTCSVPLLTVKPDFDLDPRMTLDVGVSDRSSDPMLRAEMPAPPCEPFVK